MRTFKPTLSHMLFCYILLAASQEESLRKLKNWGYVSSCIWVTLFVSDKAGIKPPVCLTCPCRAALHMDRCLSSNLQTLPASKSCSYVWKKTDSQEWKRNHWVCFKMFHVFLLSHLLLERFLHLPEWESSAPGFLSWHYSTGAKKKKKKRIPKIFGQ